MRWLHEWFNLCKLFIGKGDSSVLITTLTALFIFQSLSSATRDETEEEKQQDMGLEKKVKPFKLPASYT